MYYYQEHQPAETSCNLQSESVAAEWEKIKKKTIEAVDGWFYHRP